MFKVVVNDGKDLPDDKILYVISKNGVFLKKRIGIVESLTKVSGVSFLNETKPYARLHIPKIPLRTFARVMHFFRKIYEVHKTECNAILYYNEVTKKYRIKIPPQETTGASVKYIRIPAMEGYVRLSTIHSHPGFGAFHSQTDTGDEKDSDGLHITVGRINQPIFEIVASVVVGGTRFKVNPEDYIDGIQKVVTEEQKPEVVTYHSPYFSHLFSKDVQSKIPVFTKPSESVGYKFLRWSKKFERTNPRWFPMVKPSTIEYVTKWDEGDFYTFGDSKLTVNNLFPEPADIKPERREVKVKEFNPCENCAFKLFKEKESKKELTGDNHGTQQT